MKFLLTSQIQMIHIPVSLKDDIKKQANALDELIHQLENRQSPMIDWEIRFEKIVRLIDEIHKHYDYHLNELEDIIKNEDRQLYREYMATSSQAMLCLDKLKRKLWDIGAQTYYTRIRAELQTLFYDAQEEICKNYEKIAKELANDQ